MAAKSWLPVVRVDAKSSLPEASGTNKGALRIMRKRSEFLAANGGVRAHGADMILILRDRRDDDARPGLGMTITKKQGNAVARNRIRRRLRALAHELLAAHGVPGADHVIIGRASARDSDFAALRSQLRALLEKGARKLAPLGACRDEHA